MAKKTAAVQTAPNANTNPVRNVETNAVAIPEQAARQIEELVEKTGLRKETVLRRVLEVGLIRASEIMSEPTGKPATPFQEPAKARKPATSWKVRNVEIEAARQTLRDRAVFTVFNLSIIDAMTPANGKWILRELKSSLESHGLLGIGTEGLLLALGYELPYDAFLSVAAFRESMAELLARETKRGGYLFQEGQTAALALAALSDQLDEAKLLDFAARRHEIKQERNERAKAEWKAEPAA